MNEQPQNGKVFREFEETLSARPRCPLRVPESRFAYVPFCMNSCYSANTSVQWRKRGRPSIIDQLPRMRGLPRSTRLTQSTRLTPLTVKTASFRIHSQLLIIPVLFYDCLHSKGPLKMGMDPGCDDARVRDKINIIFRVTIQIHPAYEDTPVG